MFGVVFPERSFPLDPSAFTQIDPLHWVLDLSPLVGDSFLSLPNLCIFLLPPVTLPPDKALAVYVQPPGHPFLFCGAVHSARPSALLSLPWPTADPSSLPLPPPDAASAKLGVSVEDLALLPPVADAGAEARAEQAAVRVGEHLLHFLQSFCAEGDRLVVTTDMLDRWFKKFLDKARRDPKAFSGGA
ncbi:putative protein OPI10-like protein [Iris pallida]|uniref:Hikeshi-like N-terminal domain-containing protein n=1 Tax=Iris pallida TaxID=29817 RepID=A0AAX6FPK8_IRIPA|nr:putative protein OPI10-like protein [Iris pallida]